MPELVLVLMSAPSKEVAQTIADVAIDRRLIAAANIWPVDSTYRWQDNVEHASEHICLLRTSLEHFEALQTLIKELHPYQVPSIVAVPLAALSEAYRMWFEAQITPHELKPTHRSPKSTRK